ncbi:angiotensin-converting enzyme-like [Scylla paramamosain]|uniref:angiotensin-converting enzyme-like n=1 Tax=Scylla paramamosain TaxID=85552 RepID=UPI003083D1D2
METLKRPQSPCLLVVVVVIVCISAHPFHRSRYHARPPRRQPAAQTASLSDHCTSPRSTAASPPHGRVARWLASYNRELLHVRQTQAAQSWEVLTGSTDTFPYPHRLSAAAVAEWQERRVQEARCFSKWNVTAEQRRMLHLITRGPRYTRKQARSLRSLVGEMRRQYSNATLTRGGVTLHGEGDVTHLMRTCRDPGVLAWAWQAWHDTLGPSARPLFTRAVSVMNSAARRGGYSDMGDAWRGELELGCEARAAVARLYIQVAPLYRLLHAVARDALQRQYGTHLVQHNKPLPVHLSGDLWGQDWSSLLDLLLPRTAPTQHAVSALPRTAAAMVKAAQRVFQDLGFPKLPYQVVTHAWLGGSGEGGGPGGCHPSALDMFTPGDYRVVVCPGRGGSSAGRETVHELGHVHYFHAYRHQLPLLRDAPNAALHETIGDVVHLTTLAPPCLRRAHALPTHHLTGDALRNLLQEALTKLPRLAFAAALDTWRWDAFQGKVSPEEYNESFWRRRASYQGVAPPAPRPALGFDPAGKYHVAENIPYVRYLVAVVAQYQVHRGLCEAALGRPLPIPPHECPAAAIRTAVPLLREVMAAGASITWREAMGTLTRKTKDLDATPLLQYFAPLTRWLEHRVRQGNLTLGW